MLLCNRLPFAPDALWIMNGDVFFGGLPETFIPPRNALPNMAYFLGCISDVTINGEIVNFADSVEKRNGNINQCPTDIMGKIDEIIYKSSIQNTNRAHLL